MGVAQTAGANVRKNAQNLDISKLVGEEAGRQLATNPLVALASMLTGGTRDFAAGVMGQAAPLPAAVNKTQAKAVAPRYEDMPLQADGFRGVPVSVPGAVARPSLAQAAAPAASSAGDTGLDAVIERFGAMAGGVNLNDIMALTEAAKGNAAVTKPNTPKASDLLSNKYTALAEATYNATMAEAAKAKAAKDPSWKNLQNSAVRELQTAYGTALKGTDPMAQNLAPKLIDGE